MKFDISVVVPMYNAERFIRFCVDSALNQTLKNVEVVVVDDRSSDNSLNLCRELYGNNERVQILQQPENRGPGATRNRGIREASGEYIAFLDSDDAMVPENLERMFTAAKKYDADVLHNNQMKITLPLNDGSIPIDILSSPDYLLTIQLDKGESITDIETLPMNLTQRLDRWKEGRIQWSVCNKMIRRSLIMENNIIFHDMKMAEDALFCLQCLLTAKNYVMMPGGGYVVRTNEASLTRGVKTVDTIIKAVQIQLDIVKHLKAVSEKIPALQDEANFNTAVSTLLNSVEKFSLRAAFKGIGPESLRADGNLSDLFRKNFGDKAPYVEFLFFQLHEILPDERKSSPDDPETMEKIKQALKEARALGREFVLKEE